MHICILRKPTGTAVTCKTDLQPRAGVLSWGQSASSKHSPRTTPKLATQNLVCGDPRATQTLMCCLGTAGRSGGGGGGRGGKREGEEWGKGGGLLNIWWKQIHGQRITSVA